MICNTYLEEGICRKKSCSERHPKKCRYWAESPKGCRRDDGCKYLHVKPGKYDSGESVTENQVSDCDDCQYEEGGGNDRQTYVETSHTDVQTKGLTIVTHAIFPGITEMTYRGIEMQSTL